MRSSMAARFGLAVADRRAQVVVGLVDRGVLTVRLPYDQDGQCLGIAGCAYRKSNPGILVVQSAQNRATENAPNFLGGA